MPARTKRPPPNPSGICMCGCGQRTPVATYTDRVTVRIMGQHTKFVLRHRVRRVRPSRARPRRPHSKGYVLVHMPGHPRATKGYVYEHIVVAGRALGKPIPLTAQVHHVNEVRSENRPGNLVICQDAAYHKLLHLRLRALRQGGNANFLWCRFCKRWDDPAVMWVHPRRPMAHHRACERAARKATTCLARVEAEMGA